MPMMIPHCIFVTKLWSCYVSQLSLVLSPQIIYCICVFVYLCICCQTLNLHLGQLSLVLSPQIIYWPGGASVFWILYSKPGSYLIWVKIHQDLSQNKLAWHIDKICSHKSPSEINPTKHSVRIVMWVVKEDKMHKNSKFVRLGGSIPWYYWQIRNLWKDVEY